VETDLLPWVIGNRELGDDVLEVGPGPGLTTDVLRSKTLRLTAVEVDETLATELRDRLSGTNVEVIHADGTRLPFQSRHFSAAALLNMLHHVPSAALQDALLTEVGRVLRSGGVLIGADNIETPARWELHVGDTYVPIDRSGLEKRLEAAGFTEIAIGVARDRFKFVATTRKR